MTLVLQQIKSVPCWEALYLSSHFPKPKASCNCVQLTDASTFFELPLKHSRALPGAWLQKMILSLVAILHEILVRGTYYRNFLPNHYYLFCCCLSVYLGTPQSCRFIPFNKMSVLFITGVKICPPSICPMFSLLYCFLGFNSELQIFHYFFFTYSLIIMQRGRFMYTNVFQ